MTNAGVVVPDADGDEAIKINASSRASRTMNSVSLKRACCGKSVMI